MVLITGGSGLLGTNLIPLFDNTKILYPTSHEMDITNRQHVKNYFSDNQDISLVIHAAAYTNVKSAEKEFLRCTEVNVIGTFNILYECAQRNIKFVYISTDAVFDGKKGNYTISDCVNPISKYAKTKTSAELMVMLYDNSLVLRTSFFGLDFPYEKAFVDQWTSKDYIDIMAPKIYKVCVSDKRGLVHISSKRRSLYTLAKIRKKSILPAKLREFDFEIELPPDLSLRGCESEKA